MCRWEGSCWPLARYWESGEDAVVSHVHASLTKNIHSQGVRLH